MSDCGFPEAMSDVADENCQQPRICAMGWKSAMIVRSCKKLDKLSKKCVKI